MSRLDVPGRITGLDTARAVAILGMIATHVFPLMQADPSGALTPTWVGASLTGVSSALFVVRSEERRVGKECRSRWSPDDEKKKKDVEVTGRRMRETENRRKLSGGAGSGQDRCGKG